MKSKSVVLLIVSLGFGLIAAIGISQVMGNNGPKGPAIERGKVVVAAKNLEHGDDLNEETCRVEDWPLEVIPTNAVRSLEQIKNRKMTTRLSEKLPIVLSDTIESDKFGRLEIPDGYRVIGIKVSGEETIAGLLQPGDRVDLVGVAVTRDENGESQTISKTFLRALEVFTIDGKLNSGGPREATGSGSAIVGVLVTESQAELVPLVQKVAKIRLVLRGKVSGEENEEIDNIQDFYDAVFGVEKEKPQKPVETNYDNGSETHVVRIWEGDNYRIVTFEGNERITGDDDWEDEDEFDDDEYDDEEYEEEDEGYGEYDPNDDIEDDLEEDQYPGG
ncbi:MAG: Flp pilus assembly protein CpaB [Planctomycetota bacterium]